MLCHPPSDTRWFFFLISPVFQKFTHPSSPQASCFQHGHSPGTHTPLAVQCSSSPTLAGSPPAIPKFPHWRCGTQGSVRDFWDVEEGDSRTLVGVGNHKPK